MKVQNLVVTEKYTDKQGQEKKAYKTIGKVFTYDDGGMSVKIEMMPVGAWDGNANVYDIQPKQQQHGQPQQQQPQQQQYQAPQNQQQNYQQQQSAQVGQETIPF